MRAILGVRIPDEIDDRLQWLANETGRSKSYYVREALIKHLKNLEDVYLADRAMERIRKGEERIVGMEKVLKYLGLED